ncbi:perforin-1-like [Acipenser ruthenus]|uniref:perforin-1-like n=1 Tax=Acipenser ruthenus TaxID=7906 RepID=UPI0027426EB1|nr:perforin-1-like [Acipenser ruthenus]
MERRLRQLVFYFLSWTLHFLSRPALLEACTTGTANECAEAEFVPGYNLAGEGFDIVKMVRKGAYVINVNDWRTKKKTCTLCKNPFLENKAQKLPLSVVDWRALSHCKMKVSSSVYDSSESLVNDSTSSVENNWKVGLDIDISPKYKASMMLAGSKSNLAQYSMEKTKKDKFSFASHEIHCTHYSYRLVEMPLLHREFAKSIKRLPKTYDKDTRASYRSLIDVYGTHFIKQVQLGGKVKSTTSIRTCEASLKGLSETEVKDCLDFEASATIGQATNFKTEAHHCKKDQKKLGTAQNFHSMFSDRHSEVTGGQAGTTDLLFSGETDPAAYKQWMESLKTNPDVIFYSLLPIHNLIRFKGPKKDNLKQALLDYILENALLKTCSGQCKGGSSPSARDPCSCVCQGSSDINSQCCPTQPGLAKLSVVVSKATGLWGDTTSKTDAFVKVSYGSKTVQTAVIYNNDNPVWGVRFDFGPVKMSMAEELKFEVWDEDNTWYKRWNDLLGKCAIKLRRGSDLSEMCALNHGTLFFSYTLECGPSLGGPTCMEYTPSPMSAELMKSFVSRNAVPLPRSLVAEMMKGYSRLEPSSSSGNRSQEE